LKKQRKEREFLDVALFVPTHSLTHSRSPFPLLLASFLQQGGQINCIITWKLQLGLQAAKKFYSFFTTLGYLSFLLLFLGWLVGFILLL
jgi:hypothetical protein